MVNSPDFKLGTSKFRHSATRSFLTYSIIIVGTLLLLATIIDILPIGLLAGYEELQSQVSKALFYSCLGLICVILGLERALDISRIETTLDYQNQTLEKTTIQIEKSFINQDQILNSIDKHISEFKQYKLLENYHDIYNNSLLLIEKQARTFVLSFMQIRQKHPTVGMKQLPDYLSQRPMLDFRFNLI